MSSSGYQLPPGGVLASSLSGGGGGGSFIHSIFHNAVANVLGRTAHDFADIGIQMLPGLYHLGGGLIHDPTGTLKLVGESTLADLEHPLRHPGYTIADIVGLAGLGGATIGRIGAAGAALSRAGEIARVGEAGAAGAEAGAAAAAPEQSVLGALVHGPRPKERNLVLRSPQEGVTDVIAKYGSYSKNPLIAAGQQLLDRSHEAFPNAHIGPFYRKQGARIQRAEMSRNIMLGRNLRDLPARLVAKYKGLSDAEFVAARVVAEGVNIDDRIAFHQEAISSGDLPDRQVAESEKQIKLLNDARQYIDYQDVPIPDMNTTVNLPVIKPEFTKLDNFVKDARTLANLRDSSLLAAGFLINPEHAHDKALLDQFGHVPDGRLSASAINRRTAVYNLIHGNALPDNPTTLRKQLSSQRAIDRAAGRGVDWKSQRTVDLETALQRQQGQMSFDEHGNLEHGPIFSEDLANQLFRIPYVLERPPRSLVGIGKRYAGGRIETPSTLTHGFTGAILRGGGGRLDLAHVLAESVIEQQRFLYLREVRNHLLNIAVDDPSSIDPQYRQAINTDWAKSTERPLRYAADLLEKPALTDAEKSAGAQLYHMVRDNLFPQNVPENRVPGVKWIDKRLLGGLDLPNPLMSAFEYPVVQKVLRWHDALNEANKVAALYLKTSYLLPNMLGNVALSLVQQGFLMPANLARSTVLLRRLDQSTKEIIQTSVGNGFSAILKNEAGWQSRLQQTGNFLANQYGKLIDDPFRFSSFLHEARVEGFKTPQQLHDLTHNPGHADVLERISQRANDALINYERLGPSEQTLLRRLIFFYPWVKGSTRYAYTFAANNPVATGISSQAAKEGGRRQESILGAVPSYLESIFPVGKPNAKGYVPTVNPASMAILQQPAEILNILLNLAESGPNQDMTILSNLSPVDRGILAALSGGRLSSQPHAATQSPIQTGLQELYSGLGPIKSVGDYIQHGNKPYSYPADDLRTILQRFFVFGGLQPRLYDPTYGQWKAYQQQNPHG